MAAGDEVRPFFSILIPVTDQNVYQLPFTLDSIVAQTFDHFEIILIDGQTKNHTQHLFDAYRSRIGKICSTTEKNLFAMLNQGIALAKGEYVHVLLPGEFYLSRHAFRFVKEFLEVQIDPDLLYTAYMVRQQYSLPQIVCRQITEEDLKGGKVAMSLQAYWFKRTSLQTIGRFNERYDLQAGFELVCRFYLAPMMRKCLMRRVLTDFEPRQLPPRQIVSQLMETLLIIFIHFGWSKAILWWMAQNHLRFLQWWAKSLKAAVWKRSEAVRGF
jgi:hypothetical protein